MANTYFIADTHFGGEDIFQMARENYRFRTCEIKDNVLMENWNRVVKPEDTVYILGDFGDARYAKLLNGNKILVRGNHDRTETFDKEYDVPILYNNFFILSHEPIFIADEASVFANIFGHVHFNPMYKTVSARSYCVSACRINYTPVLYEDILKAMKKEEEKSDKSRTY